MSHSEPQRTQLTIPRIPSARGSPTPNTPPSPALRPKGTGVRRGAKGPGLAFCLTRFAAVGRSQRGHIVSRMIVTPVSLSCAEFCHCPSSQRVLVWGRSQFAIFCGCRSDCSRYAVDPECLQDIALEGGSIFYVGWVCQRSPQFNPPSLMKN